MQAVTYRLMVILTASLNARGSCLLRKVGEILAVIFAEEFEIKVGNDACANPLIISHTHT